MIDTKINTSGWRAYYSETQGRAADPLVALALEALGHERRGMALDLGSGAGVNARHLVDSGFARVHAVDQNPFAADHTKGVDSVTFILKRMERYEAECSSLDIVLSIRALWFLFKPDIKKVVIMAHRALRPGGVFAFNLMGMEADWVKDSVVCGFTTTEVMEITQGWEVLYQKEERSHSAPTGKTVPIQWHEWHLILRKPD
ncbi:MAG: class I SAM-dependent methyltransferase [bacterium]